MEQRENSKKRSLIIVILALITVCAVGITIWAVWFRSTSPVLAPDYAPQQTEQNAEPIESDDTSKLEAPKGGGAVSLIYSKDVLIDLSDRNASLTFGNPAKSTQNMLVQIVIQDTVVVQSGMILPGNQVTKLELLNSAKLSDGVYDGKFVVLYYNADSGEKAMINTEIPLTIHVQG